jgi:invasion protein IalB
MRHHRAKRSFPALAVVVGSLLLPSSPAIAQQAPQSGTYEPEVAARGQRGLVRQIKYGDWQKFCFKTPGTNMVCRTTISGTWDTGQTAVRADLIEREGDNKARLQLFVPVGMYLQAGTKLTVDQGKPYQIPYVWCMTNTCIAGNPAAASPRDGERPKVIDPSRRFQRAIDYDRDPAQPICRRSQRRAGADVSAGHRRMKRHNP